MADTADVVIIGAGALGAACAYFATEQGLRVHIVERGEVAGGTTSACEGNLLVSDKEAGHELDLALYSNQVWRRDLAPHNHLWEFENKGGLIVAATESGAQNLAELARRQRDAGIDVTDVAADEVHAYEPHLTKNLTAAAHYPQDCQVQPMLMAAQLIRIARERGARIWTRTEVTDLHRDGDSVTGVVTSRGTIHADHVINAAGTWAGDIAQLAGVHVPILPRRGFVLITEPLPRTVFHKVYSGDYVASTTSSDEGLQTSTVIEGTRAGTILIGSSRERVGFDATVSLPALRQIAAKALTLYPVLAKTKIMRNYHGFRPYCADHLPVIGHDPRAPGLWHAAGHEGAGIGLSVGSAKLLVQQLTGREPDLDLTPFAPERFDLVEAS
ncbi:glycine/D-amino acid oxidase-like deaminating enzyme [Prauserella sediminis]|uniref:Glycine/D-amino acid oxidase-like deaminating enzyme n=1 Tax=Prauserella sediminis TaxID=577680 RepID=A0A839XSM6_9PSEU|nr:FAD-binding oxidoreductase [Prauserella sediminis]MBB3663623.1 glycine/D-amino acid oxidase-like deaminating enzyme [Prauserella sediminis]